MKKLLANHLKLFAFTLLLLVAALPATAGDYERCPGEAGECVEMMMKKLSQRGWIGINFDMKEGKVVLSAVVPDSPAEAAGLEAGDELISVNGLAYSDGDEKAIKKMYSSLTPGDKATLVVSRDGAESERIVTLGKLPQHILAQWIGYHMIEGHGPVEEADEDSVAQADK